MASRRLLILVNFIFSNALLMTLLPVNVWLTCRMLSCNYLINTESPMSYLGLLTFNYCSYSLSNTFWISNEALGSRFALLKIYSSFSNIQHKFMIKSISIFSITFESTINPNWSKASCLYYAINILTNFILCTMFDFSTNLIIMKLVIWWLH